MQLISAHANLRAAVVWSRLPAIGTRLKAQGLGRGQAAFGVWKQLPRPDLLRSLRVDCRQQLLPPPALTCVGLLGDLS